LLRASLATTTEVGRIADLRADRFTRSLVCLFLMMASVSFVIRLKTTRYLNETTELRSLIISDFGALLH